MVELFTAQSQGTAPADDVGTLWTMRRHEHRARCALIARHNNWELRVLVDGAILVSERCDRGAETFALAESMKEKMLRAGWQQILPPGGIRSLVSERPVSLLRRRVRSSRGTPR